MSMPLQCLEMSRKIGHEPFCTDLIGVLPHEKQSVLDLGSERSLSLATRRELHLLGMIEQPHRIPTSVASGGGNLVKQGSFWEMEAFW